MKILWLSFEGIGFAVAKKLQEEGNEVLVGQVETYAELGIDKEEDPEDTKNRMSTFDGMIEKMTAKELLKKAKGFTDKNEWSVICDFNNLYRIAEQLKEMGFAGEDCTGFVFLPTEEQHKLESDRDLAKEFVKKHYDIEVGEKHDFKTIDEGIQFLNDTADAGGRIYVLKAYNDDLNAIVPSSEDPMLAKDELISAMVADRKGYESQGYLLEEKISEPLEVTPQAVFYDGEPVFFDIDIETKPLLAGDTGPQTGCASNLVYRTSEFETIAELAFPPIVYDMAMQHRGLFVWDASILVDARTGRRYFGEFCSNRWGWDSFFTELTMCESVTSYFEKVMQKQSPLVKSFGASVRMFNVKKGVDMQVVHKGNFRDIFLYDVHAVKGAVASIGYSWDLLVATGAGESIEEAVDRTYDRLEGIAFTGGGFRPKFDFLSLDYPTSILNRWNENIGKLFHGEKWEGPDIDERVKVLERQVGRIQKDSLAKEDIYRRDLTAMRDEIVNAVDDETP